MRKSDDPASIVILLRNPKPLTLPVLADLLSQATGSPVRAVSLEDVRDGKKDRQPVGDMVMVAGDASHFAAQLSGVAFAIHNLSAPYMYDPVKACKSIPDLRLRKAVKEHTAWLSMDILKATAVTPEAYRVVGRVLASLMDAECLALYHPPLRQFSPCRLDEVLAKLRSDDPIQAVFREVSEVPVTPFDDDPRLEAAEAEARLKFSEFESAFQKKDGDTFTIKTLVSGNGNSEHIWVEVDRISNGKIEGRLGNDPVDLGELKLGSKVEIETSKVEDWVFIRKGAPVGLFSMPVMQQIERERSPKK